jgi:hypothetical protein
MGLLVSFLYLLLYIAIICLIAYLILYVVRDWFQISLDGNVLKFAKIVVALIILIAIVVWLSGALGQVSFRLSDALELPTTWAATSTARYL